MSIALKSLKEELKNLAKDIKTSKPEYRGAQSTISKLCNSHNLQYLSWWERHQKSKNIEEFKVAEKAKWDSGAKLGKAQYEFRHRHIAYCLVRGTPIEKIETLPKDRIRTNIPDMKYVEKLVAELKAKLVEEEVKYEQAVCNSATGSI